MHRMERNGYLLSAKQALLFSLGAKCTGWLDIRGVQTNDQSLHCIPFMYGQPCWPFSTWDQLVLCGLLPTPTNSTPKCERSLLPLYPCSNLLSTGILQTTPKLNGRVEKWFLASIHTAYFPPIHTGKAGEWAPSRIGISLLHTMTKEYSSTCYKTLLDIWVDYRHWTSLLYHFKSSQLCLSLFSPSVEATSFMQFPPDSVLSWMPSGCILSTLGLPCWCLSVDFSEHI